MAKCASSSAPVRQGASQNSKPVACTNLTLVKKMLRNPVDNGTWVSKPAGFHMSIGTLCNREVVFVHRVNLIRDAAQLMRQFHVGDLVVVDDNGKRKPVGIVTDRDIVIAIVALGLDPNVLTVGDIMGPELVTVGADEGVFETIRLMRQRGVRRLPVITADGDLAGIVTIDDLLQLLAKELAELASVIEHEQKVEAHTRK
jgi:CBS domain-containing protein